MIVTAISAPSGRSTLSINSSRPLWTRARTVLPIIGISIRLRQLPQVHVYRLSFSNKLNCKAWGAAAGKSAPRNTKPSVDEKRGEPHPREAVKNRHD